MSNPTCPSCDCVAGCQSSTRLCPNLVEKADGTLIGEGTKAVMQQALQELVRSAVAEASECAEQKDFDALHSAKLAVIAIAQPEQQASERELTDEAQSERDDWEREADNCSCHISAPCGCCTHPGNPMNQEEDETAWKPATAQPKQTAEPAILEIDFKQATDLLKMFGGEPTSITLLTGKGHSGNGLYAHYTFLPEEGALYLGEADEDALPDAAIAQPKDKP